MGTYSDYVKNMALLAAGKPDGTRQESTETRVNAAMDVDEAVKTSLGRVMAFLTAYYAEHEAEITLAEAYLAGDEDSAMWGGRVWRDIQNIASTAKRKDGTQEHLLFDDLRILADRLAAPPGSRS